MPLPPLKREHSLAVRQPNPMWTFTGQERHLLEDLLLPFETIDGRPFLYGAADCWDERLNIGLSNIRGLGGLEALNPKRAVISLHRETTITDNRYIDINGNSTSVAGKGDVPFRQYFDGFAFNDRTSMGHVASVCVDYDAQQIWAQDPQGIPIKLEIEEVLKATFPEFEYKDLMLWQQKDAHSCGILTLYNMECFARGEMPAEHVDVMELRIRYASVLGDYERSKGLELKDNKYYDRPIHQLRYIPV